MFQNASKTTRSSKLRKSRVCLTPKNNPHYIKMHTKPKTTQTTSYDQKFSKEKKINPQAVGIENYIVKP